MTRNQAFGLSLGACLLYFAVLVSASPVQADSIARRDWTTTTTEWIEPTTLTINPLDPTITREAGWTSTTGPPPFTSTITSSCITYILSFPPEEHPPITTTTTITARSTITVTDTDRPLETHYSFHTPTVTVTTPLNTYYSYHCLNTMVVQHHPWEHLTWTWSYWAHTAVTTGVCLTTTTRSTTIPGVTLVPKTTLADWEYFSESGQSVVTKHTVAIAAETSTTIDGTTTRTVCDARNPRPTTTTTVTVTRPSTTATATVTVTGGCTAAGGSSNERRSELGVVDGGDRERRDGGTAGGANTPVEVHTVVYTTVTVIGNTVFTLTGTAVVDVVTQSFPVTRIAYTTTTTGMEMVTVTETGTACGGVGGA